MCFWGLGKEIFFCLLPFYVADFVTVDQLYVSIPSNLYPSLYFGCKYSIYVPLTYPTSSVRITDSSVRLEAFPLAFIGRVFGPI